MSSRSGSVQSCGPASFHPSCGWRRLLKEWLLSCPCSHPLYCILKVELQWYELAFPLWWLLFITIKQIGKKIQTTAQSHYPHPVTTHGLGMQTKELLGSKIFQVAKLYQNKMHHILRRDYWIMSIFQLEIQDSIKLSVSDTIDILFYQ